MSSNQIRLSRRSRLTYGDQRFFLVLLLVAVPLPLCVPLKAEAQPILLVAERATSTNPQLNSAYILGIGDRVRIDVFGVEKYSGDYLVLTDGTLNLPGIGVIQVEGLTIPQAQAVITQRLTAILKQPTVTLSLTGLRPVQVAISGEVNRPGSYNLSSQSRGGSQGGDTGTSTGGQGSEQFSRLTKALQQAGGITQAADIRQVQLRRAGPQGSVITLNLEELLREGNLGQDPILLDGDSIFIPTALSIESSEIRQLISTNLAPDISEPLQVVVVGEVFRPGVYSVTTENDTSDPPTVTKAIQQAGGITESANIRQVEVRRITRSGLQTTEVNLWELLQSGDITQDPFLQEGDTIIIPTATEIDPTEIRDLATASFAPATINVNVVGEVITPGIIQVPPNTPMNQALLAAGGFDRVRAKRSKIELIRLNPDGSVSRRQISVDLAQGVSEENNPVLQNNDILIVDRSGFTSFADATDQIFGQVSNFISALTIFRVFFGSSGGN
ncbi:MAG: SLBB domain-containing protein [Microcoleaceae cyanobacterium]